MHGLLFYFAGGQAFWWGLVLVLLGLAAALGFPSVSGWQRIAVEIALIAGAGFIWMAGPPLSGGFYFLWIVTVAAWLLLFQPRFAERRFPMFALHAVIFLFALVFLRFELPYIRAPQLHAPEERPAAVIGDSLSAGIAAGETVWPDILEEQGWQIDNFAVAGARLDDARTRQAAQLREEHRTVILMIGGNDLVRRTSPAEYAEHLDGLIKEVVRPGREVVLVELPFIPGYREYGRIQREAADSHGAKLIPRRYLARVLTGDDATLDGLHFSDEGHRVWARILAGFAE